MDGATGVPTRITLTWAARSDPGSYDYCLTTTPTASGSNCAITWMNVGMNTSIALYGLENNTTYYWQVRANNAGGATYADGGAWWSFTTAYRVFLPMIVR